MLYLSWNRKERVREGTSKEEDTTRKRGEGKKKQEENTMHHHEECFITHPTYRKYLVLSAKIDSLRMKDKRTLFNIMRKSQTEGALDHNTFFPEYGFTAGEFATWQILNDTGKARRRKTNGD